ncbi:hypothetical protein RJ55_02637 [Drechmeria coniospora]|nr:hypothetical protein RJ55_02637 [Drechmeria coniospora]
MLPAAEASPPKTRRWANGLTLIHDFITEEEEAVMIAAFCDAEPDATTLTGAPSRKRVSQHHGHHFDYTTFGASETTFTPPPDYVRELLPRLPVQEYLPDQFTMQYYPPGAGIPPHVDTHSLFAEALYSLSLGSAVPMRFRRCDARDARRMRLPKRSLAPEPKRPASTPGAEAEGMARREGGGEPEMEAEETEPEETEPEETEPEETMELLLPPRSLLLMMGPSRYGYTHGIRGRKTDQIDGRTVARTGRYSMTMRTVKRGADAGCDCAFPGVCDARIAEEAEARAR